MWTSRTASANASASGGGVTDGMTMTSTRGERERRNNNTTITTTTTTTDPFGSANVSGSASGSASGDGIGRQARRESKQLLRRVVGLPAARAGGDARCRLGSEGRAYACMMNGMTILRRRHGTCSFMTLWARSLACYGRLMCSYVGGVGATMTFMSTQRDGAEQRRRRGPRHATPCPPPPGGGSALSALSCSGAHAAASTSPISRRAAKPGPRSPAAGAPTHGAGPCDGPVPYTRGIVHDSSPSRARAGRSVQLAALPCRRREGGGGAEALVGSGPEGGGEREDASDGYIFLVHAEVLLAQEGGGVNSMMYNHDCSGAGDVGAPRQRMALGRDGLWDERDLLGRGGSHTRAGAAA